MKTQFVYSLILFYRGHFVKENVRNPTTSREHSGQGISPKCVLSEIPGEKNLRRARVYLEAAKREAEKQ
jgi:hypothetical protein